MAGHGVQPAVLGAVNVPGLRRFAGRRPIELLGGVQFPEIGELPYLLTLAGYGFYWFRLTAATATSTEEGGML